MTSKRGWPKRRSPERLAQGRITRLENLAIMHGLKFDDLFRKSDAWLLDQLWIGPLCVQTLREMQGLCVQAQREEPQCPPPSTT